MDLAIMEQVLKEILRQQKEIATSHEKANEATQQVFVRLDAFDKKLDTLKIPANDTSGVLMPVKRWIEEVKVLVEAQPKTVVHEKSFQLFPNKPEEYYKIIFGGLFRGLVILIVFIYALVIINRYIKEREYLHYKQAWQLLYSLQNEDEKQSLERFGKTVKKKMFLKFRFLHRNLKMLYLKLLLNLTNRRNLKNLLCLLIKALNK